jgi:tetratricopeptide (TPR) repeat protein
MSTRKDVLLFTPQRLFGEVGSSPEILTHEPFLERARLQREQERDGLARLALGGYVVARLLDKLLLLNGDGGEDEGFRWQLEAVRRHVNDLPDAPESAHLTGVVAAVPASGRASSGLWMGLTAYAYFLEHEGRLEEALEALILAARTQGDQASTSDFASYALTAGRLNRQLARWDEANRCYSATEEAALKVGDNVRALRGRLGRGAVDRGLGNLPRAREIAESVVRDASDLELPEVQALAYADLGAVYALQGLRVEELQANYNAFRLTPDPVQRMRTLGDLGIGLYRLGALSGARLAFEIVIDSNTSFGVRTNALLELMDLESYTGNRVAFERCRNMIEGSRASLAPSVATDYQYKLGIGLIRFGQAPRGRAALVEGLTLAEAHRLNAWYFKIEQALAALAREPEPQTPDLYSSDFSAAPEIREMEQGLREYASAAH